MTDKIGKVLVWDWTVRLFHWGTVLLIPALWYTAEQGIMDWHRRLGLTLFGVLIFRIYWGFAGTQPARFVDFIKGPDAILSYLKGLKERPYRPSSGHNPVGGLSVIAMLAALVAQVGFGLFAVDVDGLESGPLARFVDFDTGRQFSDLHEMMFNILVALIGLHIAAILVYRVLLKSNLVTAMVTGRRSVDVIKTPDSPDANASLLRIALGIAIALACVWGVAS